MQFQFHRYENPSNRLASGGCCDDYFCLSSCDTLFRSVCLRNGGTSHSQAGHCIPGTIHHNPGSIGGNTVTFYQYIGSLSNPFHYTRSGSIPEVSGLDYYAFHMYLYFSQGFNYTWKSGTKTTMMMTSLTGLYVMCLLNK